LAKPTLILVAVLVFAAALLAPLAQAATPPPSTGALSIVNESPGPDAVVSSKFVTVSASFVDTGGTVNPANVLVFVDHENVTGVESLTVTSQKLTYTPSSILPLREGNNSVTIDASDSSGNSATLSWNFTVNTNLSVAPSPLSGIKPTTILLYIGVTAGLAGAAVGGYILFLKQTTRFTFRRYFATHPVKTQYLVVYVPLVAAFLVVIVGLDYVYNAPGLPAQAPDWVLILGIFVALTTFGVDARHEMNRTRAYERAFAQFLFEMADAMRGGIDPAKAVVELSKTHTNILARHLRIAADGIRLGRPFDVVLREMAVTMNSPLISRYAGLIADATGVGGETATVVYRAAKDMDDFVKIEDEREKQLMLPVAVVYIAFAVLMAVLFALIYISPSLGTLNINFLGANPLANSGPSAPTTVPRLDDATLKERFFDLMIINALGTGAIIGAFTEGRARYGILHSLGLVAATTIAFAIVFPS